MLANPSFEYAVSLTTFADLLSLHTHHPHLTHTGRCAFTRRLKAPTEQVLWHEETGDYYLLVSAKDIQVRIVFCSAVWKNNVL